MTSTDLKALQDTNLASNNSKAITAQKLREVTNQLIINNGGWVNYKFNTNTPITINDNNWAFLQDDGIASVNDSFIPYYKTDLFSISTINFSGFPLGTVISVKNIVNVSAAEANTNLELRARFLNSDEQLVSTEIFDYKLLTVASELQDLASFISFPITSELLNGYVYFEIRAMSAAGISAYWKECFIKVN
jgi:hypothetical protein